LHKNTLAPDQPIEFHSDGIWDVYDQVTSHPFGFYLSGRGYHFVEREMYFMYWLFVLFYAMNRPIGGHIDNSAFETTLEVLLWTFVSGFILHEIVDVLSNGLESYFQLAVKRQTKMVDIGLSMNWIVIAGFRLHFAYCADCDEYIDSGEYITTWQQDTYLFLFATQIVLLTVRLLMMLNTSAFGKMLQIFKLITVEAAKFLTMYLVIVIGFFCGIWFIMVDTQPGNEWHSFLYTFQVLIGRGDLMDVIDHTIIQIYLLVATVFGALILTNLLIALMVTEYKRVSERAAAEVTFNQVQLAYDLCTHTSRVLPAPLNIIPLALGFVVWLFNFIISLINPRWNLFAHLHSGTFQKLKDLNIRELCRRTNTSEDEVVSLRLDKMGPSKYLLNMSRLEVFTWTLGGLRALFGCTESGANSVYYQRIHHKNNYGYLVVHGADHTYAVDGISVTKYIDLYEQAHGTRIHQRDRDTLSSLTKNVVICTNSFRPVHTKNYMDDLVHPFIPLLDYISTLLFPLTLLPILFISSMMAVYECIVNRAAKAHDTQSKESWMAMRRSNIELMGTVHEEDSFSEQSPLYRD